MPAKILLDRDKVLEYLSKEKCRNQSAAKSAADGQCYTDAGSYASRAGAFNEAWAFVWADCSIRAEAPVAPPTPKIDGDALLQKLAEMARKSERVYDDAEMNTLVEMGARDMMFAYRIILKELREAGFIAA